jgi:hypothetical protein
MKRFLIIVLLTLLLACVPTPEEDYLVGKAPSETVILNTASMDVSADSTPAPTFCVNNVSVDKGSLSEIRFSATLEHMDTAVCPVYPLKPVSFDVETVERLISAFAPDTRISVGEGEMTLADIEAELAETIRHLNNVDTMTFDSEADKAQYLSEEQEILTELQEAYRRVRDLPVGFVEAAALVEQDKVDFRLIDASGITVAKGKLTCGIEAGDPRSSLFRIVRLTDDDAALDPDEQNEAALKPICEDYLSRAGVDGFAFNCAEHRREQITDLFYTRTFPRLPYSVAYGITPLQWRDYDDGTLFTEPAWSDESIRFECKNGRVVRVDWVSKSEIGQAVREVSVLPFSDLFHRIVNGLTFQYSVPCDREEQSHRIEISRVQLGMKRVPVYGSVGQYQLIPACTVIGRFVIRYRAPEDAEQRILDQNMEWYEGEGVLLVLNAIDGSIVG